jgi:lipopolysaccharide transport system ATP-binding protein
MGNTAIKVENIGKLYRLGQIGTGTLSHDLNRWWAKMRGKEDPFARIGETNDRTKKGSSDYVWALKDISFQVKEGDVLGIIGRNGAGKSTLLKILSKVTTPSAGKIKVKGRIASLLEVGTGFHPELTGRENIFLNGAILGMTKAEIKKKFDEIVDFSGVERYIDTPVKRYSSGMYVRLAFAVAAFLEPEILIVDEVLAVGDAEFQKKCMGRMKDVSVNDGRTVLFVSHNMAAIQKLCNRGILLNNGSCIAEGDINTVLRNYLDEGLKSSSNYQFKETNGSACVKQVVIEDIEGKSMLEIPVGKPWRVKVFVSVKAHLKNMVIGLGMVNNQEVPIRTSWNLPRDFTPGTYVASFEEDQIKFAVGQYRFVVGLSIGTHSIQYLDDNILFFISEIVASQDESVIKSDNGILINQMKMSVEKIG